MREEIVNILKYHVPTTGMAVTSGVTCRCGAWCEGYAGKTLLDHQSYIILSAIKAALQ